MSWWRRRLQQSNPSSTVDAPAQVAKPVPVSVAKPAPVSINWELTSNVRVDRDGAWFQRQAESTAVTPSHHVAPSNQSTALDPPSKTTANEQTAPSTVTGLYDVTILASNEKHS